MGFFQKLFPPPKLPPGEVGAALVDISDPANPSQVGSVTLSGLAGGADPDLSTLRTNLQVAIDGQNLLQRGSRLMIDAFQAAQGAGFDLDNFTGLVVVVNGPFLRGQSWHAFDN